MIHMGQNQITGLAGYKFGRESGRIVAKFLDTNLLSAKSNEIILDGKHFVIKSARRKTPSIGITANLFDRLQGIIVALETENGKYILYKVDLKMNPPLQTSFSKSSGHTKNKVIKISRKSIQMYGRIIGEI